MPRAGRGGAFLADFMAVWDGVKSALPYLEDEAVVTVSVGPNGTRREAYFLAAAVAFSLVRRYDIAKAAGPPPSVLMLEWDAASNEVRMTLRYKTCLVTAAASDTAKTLAKLYLLTGPPEEVRGADWNYTGVLGTNKDALGPLIAKLDLVPGIRDMINTKPVLPKPDLSRWVNRPILTRNQKTAGADPRKGVESVDYSPNPRPSGDHRSRGTLYQMVYSALTTPQGAGLKGGARPPGDITDFMGA